MPLRQMRTHLAIEFIDAEFPIDSVSRKQDAVSTSTPEAEIMAAGYGLRTKGIPLKQLHSYDYGGPYAGFKGAINFYKEIDRMVNSRVWQYMRAPWQEHPELSATYAWE